MINTWLGKRYEWEQGYDYSDESESEESSIRWFKTKSEGDIEYLNHSFESVKETQWFSYKQDILLDSVDSKPKLISFVKESGTESWPSLSPPKL